jgi:hypothetical protein
LSNAAFLAFSLLSKFEKAPERGDLLLSTSGSFKLVQTVYFLLKAALPESGD